MRRVAIIGYGAIGRSLAEGLREAGETQIAVLLAPGSHSRAKAEADALSWGMSPVLARHAEESRTPSWPGSSRPSTPSHLATIPDGYARTGVDGRDRPGHDDAGVDHPLRIVDGIDGLRRFAPDLVVEAAGAGAVREHGAACLALGVPLLLSSVGTLGDDGLRADLAAAAKAAGTRVYLPSGALAGLDYVRATRGADGLRVAYESRKPPAAWADELARLGHPARPEAPITLFEGDARKAARLYPANLNVAATLALAGAGFEATDVSVVVDPAASGNTHGVTVRSALGTLDLSVANRPSPDNPKTSWIVSRALLAAIEQHFATIVFL